jgi:radical SAM superfamily enzyme YgiQ (UPF0313 family)
VNFPVGLGIISAVLKEKGHEAKILHFNEEMNAPFDLKVLENRVNDFDPQLIAFSSTSNQFQYVKLMANHIKKLKDYPILVGGIHATISAKKVLQLGAIDMVCLGEGEYFILEVLEKMERGRDHTDIQNMGLRHNGAIKINPIRPLLDAETLDSLPFPDREGFKFGDIVKSKNGWANVMASRGCLRKCSYCVNHYFHKLYAPYHKTKENLRYRRVDTVLREIEEMVETYPWIKLINLDDDNITLDIHWLEEFCDTYPGRVGLQFACNIHPAQFELKRAKMLAKAGCVEVKIGLESGSERLRREILKRPSKDEVLMRAFSAAEEAGLRSWSFNMVGLPQETKEEMLMTAKLNAKIRPYIIRCSIFFPYEGTELYEYAHEHNLILEDRAEKVSSVFEDSVLDMSQLPKLEIDKFKTMFKWYVDANSDIEAAPLFQQLIDLFENLPEEMWLTGEASKRVKQFDGALDSLLQKLQMEHYATRKHLDLNFTRKLNYELP